MRGSPPIQAALVVMVLLLLLIPLHRLTKRVNASETLAPAVVKPTEHVHLGLKTTAAPFRFQISYLGRTLWAGEATGAELEKDVDIDFPKEGIDLAVDATWENPALVALQISVSPPDGTALDKTLWGRGKISDVVTFKEE
jgi:hypothetical protein